jgi:hypothetical protein
MPAERRLVESIHLIFPVHVLAVTRRSPASVVVEPTEMFLRSNSAFPSSILLETTTMSHFANAHVDGPELEKLSELRAKTERQVLSIIHSKLDLGLNFVALAEETDSSTYP